MVPSVLQMTNRSGTPRGILGLCLQSAQADILQTQRLISRMMAPAYNRRLYWGVIRASHVIFTAYDIMSDLNIFLLPKTVVWLLLDLADLLLRTMGKQM